MYQRKARLPSAWLLLPVLFGSGACGSQATTSDDSSHTSVNIESPSGEGISLDVNAVTVEMDDSVRYTYASQSGAGRSLTAQKVNDLEFSIKGDKLILGPHLFRGIEAGDTVLLSAKGIFVNGERRWDMPGQ